MAKNVKIVREKKIFVSPFKEFWTKINYYFLIGAIIVLFAGYYLMAQSPWDNILSLSISPIVLLVGYVILIPLAILFKPSLKKNKESVSSKS